MNIFIYKHFEQGWHQIKKFECPAPLEIDAFGRNGRVDGDIIAITAWSDNDLGASSGSVYLYAKDHGGTDNWGFIKKVLAPSGESGDLFGISVDLSGEILAVGARGDDDAGADAGAVYLFGRNVGGADNWGLLKKITASDSAAGGLLGLRVAILGDTLLAYAFLDASGSRAVYVFGEDVGGIGNWGEQTKLSGLAGISITSIDMNGDLALVGTDAEKGLLFARNQGGNNSWGLAKQLVAANGSAGDWFGRHGAISGDTILIGAQNADVLGIGADKGAAHLFLKDYGGSNNWGEFIRITSPSLQDSRRFGETVAIGGNFLIIGDPSDAIVNTHSGAIHIYSAIPRVTRIWDGEGPSFSWHEALNWTGDAEPVVDDDVLFNSTSSKACDSSSDVEVNRFTVDAAYGGTISIGNWQTFTAHGDVLLQGGTFNFGITNIFRGDFSRTDGMINRRYMYFYGTNPQNLQPGPQDVIYGALEVGEGGASSLEILGNMTTTALIINGSATAAVNATTTISDISPSKVEVRAGGSLTVADGAMLDARAASDFSNAGTVVETGSGKILRAATLLVVTDDFGVSTELLVGSPFYVWLIDEDENLNGMAKDTTTVEILNLANGDAESLTLTETGTASETFRNMIAMPTQVGSSATIGNGILEARGDDFIRIRYTDDEDTSDVLTLDIPGAGVYLPVVEALSVSPGATLDVPPSELLATLNHDVDSATVASNSVVLTRGGPDLILDTDDDVAVAISGLSVVNGNQIKLDLTDVTLPDDRYRLTLSGTTSSASPSFLTNQSTSSPEEVTSISQDGLELFFFSDRPGGTGYYDLYTCTRPNKASPWSAPVEIVELNTDDYEGHPIISRSGLSLYFTSIRAGGAGDADLWMATRSAVGQPWENPVNLAPLNSSVHDQVPIVSSNELTIWFISQRPGVLGSYDVFTSTRSNTYDEWAAPTMVPELNTNVFECPTWVSIDGLTMYLISARSGSLGGWDIWRTSRPSGSDPWTTPENVSELNSASDDGFMTMITGENTVWFSSKRSGSQGDWDILETQIDTSIRDTNGIALDGEFLGTLPSGNGIAGGNFVGDFTLDYPPGAAEDYATVDEGQSINIDVAANDSDVIDELDLSSIQIIVDVAFGILQVNTDGTVDYTHDGSENFSDGFTYTIKDMSGVISNEVTASISINSINDLPIAEVLGSDPFYVEENEFLQFEGNGTDAEDGNSVNYDWNWDDGTTNGTDQNPSHAWDEPGVYIVTLIVTDQGGVSSDPVTVQVIVTPKAGERDLFLKRGKFMINWKAHADGIDKDSFKVQGWLNPAGINAALNGATFELSVNGFSIGVVPLAANGKGSTATAKVSLKAKTGAFSFSIKDVDLSAALGLSNTTEAGSVELAIGINVQNAGLYTDTIMAHAQFDYTTKQDISSKGSFNFKTADSADGYFFAAKTTVTEDKIGAHKVSVKGYFDAPGGASLVPAGDVTLTIGMESITVPVASLTVSGGVISLPKGTHPDLAKFILDTNKELFTIQTNALASTGVPPVGNPATSHDLLIRIEIPTAGDPIVFETTVEILRSSPTSKRWKR